MLLSSPLSSASRGGGGGGALAGAAATGWPRLSVRLTVPPLPLELMVMVGSTAADDVDEEEDVA